MFNSRNISSIPQRFAEIFETDGEREGQKQLELLLTVKSDEEGFYDKFGYKCETRYTNERGTIEFETPYTKKLSFLDRTTVMLPICREFIELKFTLHLNEHDLSGRNIKAMNSPSYKEALIKDIVNLQTTGLGGDMLIQADDGEILAHKAIVAARSNVLWEKLKKMIKTTSGEIVTIQMDGYNIKVVNKFVHFLYSGEIVAKPPAAYKRDYEYLLQNFV
jgi:hypothetical protein